MSINMNETCVNRVWAQPSESCLRTSWRERLGCLALNPMMRITRSLRKCWTRQRPRRWHAAHLRLIIFIIILCNQTSPLLPPSFLHRTSFCRFLSARLPSSLHHIFLLYTKSHVWCGKFAFVTCVCLCLNLPSVSQDCSAFTMLWLREQQWCTRVKCSRDIRALVE